VSLTNEATIPYFRCMFFDQTKTRESEKVETLVDEEEPLQLIVWNDEVNTFEHVIETLIEVCGHSQEQAEQCTLLIHFKGKCSVRNGDYDTLKPMCDAITERGIGATIEATVR
jgi:ATP-dependent Clp protease adaptor protein ClpS